MKFGKRLKQQIQETFPQWRDKFLSYKDLKKLVRLNSSAPLRLLDGLLDYAFFMEQEEDFIIRHRELQQRIRRVIDKWEPNGNEEPEREYKDEMARIRKDTVDFQGDMVLLINYSTVNYTGLGKILEKYDKGTGGFLRKAFIQMVVEQPFSFPSSSKNVKAS